MKKLLIILTILSILLCGCQKTEPAAETEPETTEAVTEPAKEIDPQIALILQKQELWKQEDPSELDRWYYTVTDLDHNGQAEIVCAITQGTGMFTTANLFEVNYAKTDLDKLRMPVNEGEALPDIIMTSADGCIDAEKGFYYYFFTDVTRNGAAEYATTIAAITMHNGVLLGQPLAWEYHVVTNGVENVTYECPLGPITQEQFENAKTIFSTGMESFTAHFDWFSFAEDVTAERLQASYDVFCG